MALDMHLEFKGGPLTIKGSSEHKNHKDQIPILSWNWGLFAHADLHNTKSLEGGKPSVQDLRLVKRMDGVSHLLINALARGVYIDEATLYLSSQQGEQKDMLVIGLSEGVRVVSYTTGGSSGMGDELTEEFQLHFGKFAFKFMDQDAKGTVGAEKAFEYNMRSTDGK